MRGSVKSRYEGSWSIVLDLGHETVAGKKRRKQKWVTFHSTPGLSKKDQRTQAEAKLAELLNDANKGTFISPSTVTLIDYLRA